MSDSIHIHVNDDGFINGFHVLVDGDTCAVPSILWDCEPPDTRCYYKYSYTHYHILHPDSCDDFDAFSNEVVFVESYCENPATTALVATDGWEFITSGIDTTGDYCIYEYILETQDVCITAADHCLRAEELKPAPPDRAKLLEDCLCVTENYMHPEIVPEFAVYEPGWYDGIHSEIAADKTIYEPGWYDGNHSEILADKPLYVPGWCTASHSEIVAENLLLQSNPGCSINYDFTPKPDNDNDGKADSGYPQIGYDITASGIGQYKYQLRITLTDADGWQKTGTLTIQGEGSDGNTVNHQATGINWTSSWSSTWTTCSVTCIDLYDQDYGCTSHMSISGTLSITIV